MFVDDFGKFSHATTANKVLRNEAPSFDFMELFFAHISLFNLISALNQANTFITTTHSVGWESASIATHIKTLICQVKLA